MTETNPLFLKDLWMFTSVSSASALLGCPVTLEMPKIVLGLEAETQVSWL